MTTEPRQEPQLPIVQQTPRITTYLVGPRRALRRLTTPVMVRVVVGLVRLMIVSILALLLLAAIVAPLLTISAALLSVALNLLGAVVSFVITGLVVCWAVAALRQR